eukprot:scaffold12769_cov141-Cylindrotheca_fusiformis.AAC.15
MPKTPARRKRKQEEEEVVVEDVKEEEEEDDDQSSSVVDDEDMMSVADDEEEDVDMKSPSPIAKKDMFLRSGKRKRRRSKETTGLTPPEQVTAKKRARRSKAPNDSQIRPKTTNSSHSEENDANPNKEEEKPAAAADATATNAKKGRDSLLFTDRNALAAAQEPENGSSNDNNNVEEEEDEGRRLFDGRPPPMTEPASNVSVHSAAASAKSVTIQTTTTQIITATSQEQQQTQTQPVPYGNGTTAPAEPELEIPPPSSRYGTVVRLILLLLFSLLFSSIWPLCVKMADVVIPLNESAFATLEEGEATIVEEDLPPPVLQVSSVILNGLETLQQVQSTVEASRRDIAAQQQNLLAFINTIQKHADVSKRKLMTRISKFDQAEKELMNALQEDDLSSDLWTKARDTVDGLILSRNKLIDTSAVTLWHVDNPVECKEADMAIEMKQEEEEDPLLEPKLVQTTETNLLLRAAMSAERIVKSKDAEAKIRAWVRDQIDSSIQDEPTAKQALELLNSPSSLKQQPNGAEYFGNVGELIQGRLAMEVADGTGLYDYASRINGAKVIYGGKRGTTKSLVDTLPLYNRILQLARLRFYGYGPEAAITPTYPRHSLGQCWSFEQMPVKEQLKRRRRLQKDDHKHGNFGTLTISLPKPVRITTVSIEHPPDTITDTRNGAIRSFRIIAYEDALANTKSWNLGSFEYDIAKGALQEFEVSTDMFGKAVPEMQSVSLAIDSNWGLNYSCLYRFRVHGNAMGDDDDEDSSDD